MEPASFTSPALAVGVFISATFKAHFFFFFNMDSVLHVLFHQSYGVLHTFVYFVNICLITVYPIRQGLHKFQQALPALFTIILVV